MKMLKSLLSFFLLLMLPCYALANAKCSATSFDQTETIAQVIDGDTVRLMDGSLVRLIGIDAPEMDFDDATKSEADALKAKEYLAHPLLGARLIQLTEAFASVENKSAYHILGAPDDLKMKSSMTLFSLCSREGSIFHQVLWNFYDGERCSYTERCCSS